MDRLAELDWLIATMTRESLDDTAPRARVTQEGSKGMQASSPVYLNEKRDFAYELKFLLPASAGELALAWAQQHLCPDPQANGSTNGSYLVNSLYFDTPKLDVYNRTGSYSRCKYRVRRYGSETAIFLERKLKSRGQVGKRRTRIPDDELLLLNQKAPLPAWPGYWFHRRLLARDLSPRCQISYERVALIGMSSEGPVRLTLDRQVRCLPAINWTLADAAGWKPILVNEWILELKFRLAWPALFKTLTEELGLTPQPVSKYRLSVQAFGWDPASQNACGAQGNGHVPEANLTMNLPADESEPIEPPDRSSTS